VLAFYPADWSPVCGDEMALFNAVLPELTGHGAQFLGLPVDGPWCHAAFATDRKLHFPLLADFEPEGAVARAYGVYREADGTAERALWSGAAQAAATAGVTARTRAARCRRGRRV
jgi:peroxiredoxin